MLTIANKMPKKKLLERAASSFINTNIPFVYGNALIKVSKAGCVIGLKLEITSI